MEHKLALASAEDKQSDAQSSQASEQTVKVGNGGRRNPSNCNRPHEEKELVDWVHMIHRDESCRDNRLRIKDRGQEVQDRKQNSPQELHIPEIYYRGSQHQADADTEENQEEQNYGNQKQAFVEPDTCDCHHDQQGNQGNDQIDPGRQHLGYRKYIFGHVHLRDQASVAHDGLHSQVCRLGEVIEQDNSAHQVDDKVIYTAAKERREHKHIDEGHQQGIEETP